MDPGSIIEVGVIFVCLVVIALNSAVESSLTNISRLRLHQLLERGVPRAQALADLLANPRRLPTILLMVNLLAMLIIASLITTLVLESNGDSWTLVLAIGLIALVVLIFGVMAPKARAQVNPEKTALNLLGYVGLLQNVAGPLAALVSWIARPFARLLGARETRASPFVTEEEMRMLVNVAEEDGVIQVEEEHMIHQIFEFGDTVVREVMVPRPDIIAAEDDEPLGQVVDRILQYGYTRLPVYHESIDNIVGIVNAKDLLRALREGRPEGAILDLLRKPRFVPETKPVDDLLRELQHDRVQLAIIVDEYGGTAGLVTIEDIVEEIVGEIRDEYDVELPMIEPVGDDEWRLDARTPLDDVNDLLGVEWDEEDVDTIGGLVQDRLGEIPDPGDSVEIDGIFITVLSTEGLRIKQVMVRRGLGATGGPDEDGEDLTEVGPPSEPEEQVGLAPVPAPAEPATVRQETR